MSDYSDIFRLDNSMADISLSFDAVTYENARDEIIEIIHKYNLSLAQSAYLFKGIILKLGNTPIKDL